MKRTRVRTRVIIAGEIAKAPLREGRFADYGAASPAAQIDGGGSVSCKTLPSVSRDTRMGRRYRVFSDAGSRFC